MGVATSEKRAFDSAPSPSTQERTRKENEILAACNDSNHIEHLCSFVISEYGLLNDGIRRKAWPLLLNCYTATETKKAGAWKHLPQHRDEAQVELDVERAFNFHPTGIAKHFNQHKQELLSLIVAILRRYPQLSYFQGYHDIAQIFLLVLGPEEAEVPLAHLTFLHLRDFMLPSVAASVAQLRLLPHLLQALDQELSHHLSTVQPYFALSATITMYAHDIQEYSNIARLFDFLIAQPAVISLYLFAVIVLSRRKELLEVPFEEPEILHSLLTKFPRPLDVENLVAKAMQVFHDHPPESLPQWAWWKISSSSALKTSRWGYSGQAIADGERMFSVQVEELRHQERNQWIFNLFKRYRLSLLVFGPAFSIALLSGWLAIRSGNINYIHF